MEMPSEYKEGYGKARLIDREAAESEGRMGSRRLGDAAQRSEFQGRQPMISRQLVLAFDQFSVNQFVNDIQ